LLKPSQPSRPIPLLGSWSQGLGSLALGLIGGFCWVGAPVQAFEPAGGMEEVQAIAAPAFESLAFSGAAAIALEAPTPAAIAPANAPENLASSDPASAIPITPGQRALIEELLILTRQEELFNQTMALSMEQVRDSLPAILDSMLGESADAAAIEASQTLVDSLLNQLLTGLQSRIQFSDIAEEVYYPLYAKNFSEAQLQDMIDFYETPTGKHTIAVMPQLVQDSMALTQARLMPVMLDVLQEVMGQELGGL
jgi:uncharacterized protein